MTEKRSARALWLLGVAAALGSILIPQALRSPVTAASRAQETGAPVTLESLAAEIEALKARLPDQAHAMVDVGHHFSNLWFAGQHRNWRLAEFNLAETKSHLRWAVRIIPKRQVGENEVNLQAILQAMENAPLSQLADTITAKDKGAFEKAYRFTLESCYALPQGVGQAVHPATNPHGPRFDLGQLRSRGRMAEVGDVLVTFGEAP